MWEKLWIVWEKFVNKRLFTHGDKKVVRFAQFFTIDLHGDFREVLHMISTELKLAIDFLLDFVDLITKNEVQF